jgi:CheY-like chemotaxis protein
LGGKPLGAGQHVFLYLAAATRIILFFTDLGTLDKNRWQTAMIGKRILVVDDEERIREVVRMCLVKLARWEVIVAGSGEEAIQTAIAQAPDAILLDVSMPGMNGLETLQHLQRHPQTTSIPVIFLTAKVQPNEQLQYKHLGVAGLIVKPFDPLQICKDMSQLLGWN